MATKPKTAAEILASTIPAPVGVHASLWNRYVCFLKKIVFCIVFNTRLYYIFQYNITWKYIFKFISTSNKKNFTLWANWWSSWYLKSRTFVIYWSYGNESMCHEQVTWPDYSCLHMSVHITNQHAFGAFFFFFFWILDIFMQQVHILLRRTAWASQTVTNFTSSFTWLSHIFIFLFSLSV